MADKKTTGKTEPELCKYQGFDVMRIRRSEITEASYNPRQMDEEADRKLRRKLKDKKLVEALVWNKRTGVLVGGHQRLRNLDRLQHYKSEDLRTDYLLDVCAVDVDEKREKELNIILNNPNLAGSYDNGALAQLLIESDIEFKEVEFTQADCEVMFNETELSRLNGYEQPQEVKEDIEKIKKMKEMRKTALKRYKQLENDESYKIIVFDSPENLNRFIEFFKLNAQEKYFAGEEFAEKLGLELPKSQKDEWCRDMGSVQTSVKSESETPSV